MWPTILAVVRAAGVHFEGTLPPPSVRMTRRCFVDVSASLRTTAPAAMVSTAACIEEHIRQPLATWAATLGVAAFDTAPALTLDLPVAERARAVERRLPQRMLPEPVLCSAADLDALGGDAAAFDASGILQWQWQSAVLVPALRADLERQRAEWPADGLVLDRVVERSAGAGNGAYVYYASIARRELGKCRSESADNVLAAFHGNYAALVLRLLARALAFNGDYAALRLGAPATAAPAGRPSDAPAEAICKIIAAVDRVARGSADRSATDCIVIVSPRPDALLFLLLFVDVLGRDSAVAALPPRWLWLQLPGGLLVDVVAAAAQLALYSARIGLGQVAVLHYFLALAAGSESFGQALWSTLPAANERPLLPRGPLFSIPEREPEAERAPAPRFDAAEVGKLLAPDEEEEEKIELAYDKAWVQSAYLLLMSATDLVHLYTRLQAEPALKSVLALPHRWPAQIKYARFRIWHYMSRAWTTGACGYWEDLCRDALDAGLKTISCENATEMAKFVAGATLQRFEFVRHAATKNIALRYFQEADK